MTEKNERSGQDALNSLEAIEKRNAKSDIVTVGSDAILARNEAAIKAAQKVQAGVRTEKDAVASLKIIEERNAKSDIVAVGDENIRKRVEEIMKSQNHSSLPNNAARSSDMNKDKGHYRQ